MPTITGSISHRLGLDAARQRIEARLQAFHHLGGILGELKERWYGDTMTFNISLSGRSTSGELVVRDRLVEYRVQVPWTVALFAGRIKQIIEESGGKLLAG